MTFTKKMQRRLSSLLACTMLISQLSMVSLAVDDMEEGLDLLPSVSDQVTDSETQGEASLEEEFLESELEEDLQGDTLEESLTTEESLEDLVPEETPETLLPEVLEDTVETPAVPTPYTAVTYDTSTHVQGVYMEYYADYDRRFTYEAGGYPYTGIGGSGNTYVSADLKHTGIPEALPLTWVTVENVIDNKWLNGTVAGTNSPSSSYEDT